MPAVRFQIKSLLCTKSEDRGLLDTRSEDEVYLHGAVYAASQFKPILVGDTAGKSDSDAFKHLKIRDGQHLDVAPSEDNGWVVELDDDAQVTVGIAGYEEDADRSWPPLANLRSDAASAIADAVKLALAKGGAPNPRDLIAASTSVMRSQAKFNVDDFLGELTLEAVTVGDLRPDNFDRTVRLTGGTRALATDFDYSLSYRLSRDDRDFAAKPLSNSLMIVLRPGERTTLTLSLLNTGRAAYDSRDVILVGSPELSGWISEEAHGITLSDKAVGVMLAENRVGPGEVLTFSLPIEAPEVLGKAQYSLRLYVPSLEHIVEHEPITLELSSGRSMICEVETIDASGAIDAEVRVVARDALTAALLAGSIKATGDGDLHATSEAFKVRSNLSQPLSNAPRDGDEVIWPFGKVQVDGYWPQLVSLRPG